MPAPKEMRVISFALNPTDAIHVYSNAQNVWLQLRRAVPTQQDIGKPSFKIAVSLTPAQAIAIAGELLTAATQQKSKTQAKPAPAEGGTKQAAPKPKQQQTS